MSETYDDEVSQLLNEWGLGDLKAKFKANYIVKQALEYLTESDIVELIPRIGQRAIFRGRLQEWRQQYRTPVPPPIKICKVEPDTGPKPEQSVTPTSPPHRKISISFKPNKTKPQEPVVSKPAIQSKVQQFYISPVPETTPSQSASTSAEASSPVPQADLAPFVTSIIRVETNCDKKTSQKKTSHPTPVTQIKRTRILQKLHRNLKIAVPATSPAPSFKNSINMIKREKSADELEEEQNTDGDHTDAKHLYPIVKLETEQSWNGYLQTSNEEYTLPQVEMDLGSTQDESIENTYKSTSPPPDSVEEFGSEDDNHMSQLQRMSTAVVRVKRKRTKNYDYNVDVRNILMNSDAGRHVLEYYEANERLDSGRRKLLIDTIVQRCWISKTRLSPRDCKLIAKELVEIFPNEREESYFLLQPGKCPKSPIYNKYRNMLRRLRVQKIGRSSIKRKSKQVSNNVDADDSIIIS